MDNEVKEKRHWFRVVSFLLLLLAALGTYNTYKSFNKMVLFFQEYGPSMGINELLWKSYSVIMLILVLWIFVASPILLSYLLHKRRKYRFCKILSIFVAIAFPWGTVIGIFSFILLRRDAIKAEFFPDIIENEYTIANE